MKCRQLFLAIWVLGAAVNVYGAKHHSGAGDRHRSVARTTLSDPGEGDYDIRHITFRLHLTDTSVYVISGDVSTTAQVVAPSMSSYTFELDSTMQIDSAKINGIGYPVTRTGFTRTVALGASLPNGAFFTAEIFYHGMPPTGSGFFNGITHSVSSAGTHMVYTVTDPWVAKDWWPVKQSADDKIDSVDMFVTLPRGVVDGSNGLMTGLDTSSVPGNWTYHWQTHYPITYYLISIAIARYSEYKSYWHFTGSADSMLIDNFFADTATFNPAFKPNFDSAGYIIDYFSSLYGRYPFWREKYGMCYTTLPGGMENQTMTTIGVTDTRTIAHELTHQWFGDNVTYIRWGDVWLSEGFATFGENLFLEHFWGAAAAKALRQVYYFSTSMGGAATQTCGEVFVTDTSGPNTIFFQPNVYYKGMAVINMLRFMAPDDSTFFQVLKTWQQTYAYSNASTDSFKSIASTIYGMNLDTFFHQWIYGKGYPKYHVTWDQFGSSVLVKLVQTRSCPTYDTTFSTLLELQLHSASADTIVKVYNNADTQIFVFDWSPAMSAVYLNPDIWTLCKVIGVVSQDTTLRSHLAAGSVSLKNARVFPNPAKDYWQVENLPADVELILSDAGGKVVWRGRSKAGVTVVPGERLSAGSYFLAAGSNKADSIKLEHW